MANGVGPPHLADATDVERWADQRSAQADPPRLVRRLVRHENDQVQRVEMRGDLLFEAVPGIWGAAG